VAFVRRARWRGGAAAAAIAVVLGAALAWSAWALAVRFGPTAAGYALLAGAAAAVAFAGIAAWRARVSIASLDAQAGLHDALLTYWPLRREPPSGMTAWLEANLAARLAAQTPPATGRSAVRRVLRVLPFVLPLLLLLLLLLWLLPAGLGSGNRLGIEGAPSGDAAGPGSGGTSPAIGDDGGNDDARGRTSPETAPSASRPPPPPTDEGGGAAARLLQLPVREEFVVPGFVGEGDTREGRARQAEQEVTAAPRGAAGGSASPAEAVPEQEFARAAERAATARHVPAEERPMVRRYFEALGERR